MPSPHQIEQTLKKVNSRLAVAEAEGLHLAVAEHRLIDGWLYVVVVPKRPGVRASDHARVMSQIERALRQKGEDKVLLVPELED